MGAVGNGYPTTVLGLRVLGCPKPMSLRPLFPAILGPWRTRDTYPIEYFGVRWALYQSLRFLFFTVAFLIDAAAFGPVHCAVSAALLGMTLRYDYWSNSAEYLAAVIVCAGPSLGLHWAAALAFGLVLGLGRETVSLLGLSLSWVGGALALGAVLSQVALARLRNLAKIPGIPGLTSLEYGRSQVQSLCRRLRGADMASLPYVVVYASIALLALPAAPLLSVGVVAATVYGARLDEPRVLTLLIPWAAMTVTRWL